MLRNGMPEREIKESLRSEGYTKEEVAKAFVPHKYDMPWWYVIFGLASLLLGSFWILKSGTLTLDSVMVLALSLVLFVSYYREEKRLKRQNDSGEGVAK